MKVEIWTDIVCPSCNTKRKIEKAVDSFSVKDKVEFAWRSFQVDPDTEYVPGQSLLEYVGKSGTITIEGKRITDAMIDIAIEAGFKLNFDKAIINNSMNVL